VSLSKATEENHVKPAPALKAGKIYRLTFPGIAARVIEPPAGLPRSENYPYLVESLFLRVRWWVNSLGEPDNIHSPPMIVPIAPEEAHSGAAKDVLAGR
jgi:hypothetical protein